MSIMRMIGSYIGVRSLRGSWWVLCTTVVFGSLQAQDRPNVLIIYSDDGLQDPGVDLLAAEGVEWNNFIGYGNPALDMAAILTGKYPLRLGVRGQWHREGAIGEETVLLSELFKSQGYTTAFFGPWYHGGQFPQTPDGQGFDIFFGHNQPSSVTKPEGCTVYPQPGKNGVLAARLLDWLAVPRQNPFFTVVALEERGTVPATDIQDARPAEKSDRLQGIIRQIMDHLDGLRLREQTIVVLMGLPVNHAVPTGYPVQGRGIVLWRGFLTSVRLPYPAGPIDIFPTVAGLCQISIPERLAVDGIHLNAIMQGAPDHTDGRPLFFNYADRGLGPFPGMVIWKSRWLDLPDGKDAEGIVPEFLPADRIWPDQEKTAYWLRSAYLEWYKALDVRSETLPVPVRCSTDTICMAAEACLRGSPGLQGAPQGELHVAVVDTLIWELLVCRSGILEVELEGRLPDTKNCLILEFKSDHSSEVSQIAWEGDRSDLEGDIRRAKVGTVLLREGKGFLRIWQAFPQQGDFHLTSVRLSAPTK